MVIKLCIGLSQNKEEQGRGGRRKERATASPFSRSVWNLL